jgi:two-component system, NarL family, invasion response regulator UvrY
MCLSELKKTIDALRPSMTPEEIERTKRELSAALEMMADKDGSHARLSRREREVMSMMLEGRRLKEIAARLDISVKTVTTHRSRLMKKLRVADNLSLYRYCIRNGLISV